ncbi:hypothetical protein SISNIDRAFT_487657 [Sistotremastrum niveocremeum HHB9708]|uniref:F-box domain-containing protein n=1 Tax=Sistotremastrum niveocremeum HHB9708 TaxID=1314777 RepID=A0A164SCB5_9AGAM|nr:hypothetical protein SISNIDRAFT_487657 [Sistotremastrum niveocremeum HHB9708]
MAHSLRRVRSKRKATPDSQENSEVSKSPMLPPEVLSIIVEELEASISDSATLKNALYTLLVTSRAFNAEAERVLYRHVEFVNETPQAGQICSALRARAAKYVQALRVTRYNGISGRRGRSLHTHFSYLPLNQMTNLRSLSIQEAPDHLIETAKLFTFLRESISENLLLSFHASIVLDEPALRFFEQQKNITEISMEIINPKLDVDALRSTDLLPALKRARIRSLPGQRFQELLQNRPVMALELSSLRDLPNTWGSVATQLTALDISDVSCNVHADETVHISESLVASAVNLRLLAYCTLYIFDGSTHLFTNALGPLRLLTHLEALALSFETPRDLGFDISILPKIVGPPSKLASLFIVHGNYTFSSTSYRSFELTKNDKEGWDRSPSQPSGVVNRNEWFDSHYADLPDVQKEAT